MPKHSLKRRFHASPQSERVILHPRAAYLAARSCGLDRFPSTSSNFKRKRRMGLRAPFFQFPDALQTSNREVRNPSCAQSAFHHMASPSEDVSRSNLSYCLRARRFTAFFRWKPLPIRSDFPLATLAFRQVLVVGAPVTNAAMQLLQNSTTYGHNIFWHRTPFFV